MNFVRVSEEQNDYLEVQFTYEEIKETVWNCDGSKVSGYDGYNMNFIKKMWSIIGEEVVQIIRDFFQGKEILKFINII